MPIGGNILSSFQEATQKLAAQAEQDACPEGQHLDPYLRVCVADSTEAPVSTQGPRLRGDPGDPGTREAPPPPVADVPNIVPNFQQGVDRALSLEGAQAGYGFAPQAAPQQPGGLIGLAGDVAGAVGSVGLDAIPLPGAQAAGGVARALGVQPPTVSDVAQDPTPELPDPVRRTLEEVYGFGGRTVGTGLASTVSGPLRPITSVAEGVSSAVGGPTVGDVGETVGRELTPRTYGEAALEFAPEFVSPALRGLRAGARLAPDVQDVIRRGGQNLDQLAGAFRFPDEVPQYAYHGTTRGRLGQIQTEGLRPDSFLSFDEGMAAATARNQAIARGDEPVLLRVPSSPDNVRRARTSLTRQPAMRSTEALMGVEEVPLPQPGALRRALADETGAIRFGDEGVDPALAATEPATPPQTPGAVQGTGAVPQPGSRPASGAPGRVTGEAVGSGSPPPPSAQPGAAPSAPGAPPAERPTAVATADQPPEGFAGNIRLSKFPEEAREPIRQWAEQNPEAIQQARRGVVSDADVEQQAREMVDQMGGDIDKLQRQWRRGEAWSAEEITAIRGVLRRKSEDVMEAARAVRANDSTQNQLRFLEAVTDQAATQQVVHGVTAEAGRALRSMRQAAFDARTAGEPEKMQELLRRMGFTLQKQGFGPEDAQQRITALADRVAALDLDNPTEVNAFLRSVEKPQFSDYLMEYWINAILSGPTTHLVNAISNSTFALMSAPERALAAAVDIPLSRLQGRNPGRFFAEVPADTWGIFQGLPEGVRGALKTMRDGINPAQASKWEFRRTAFPGIPGRVIRLPGTMLEAADNLFFNVNYRAALNASIQRQARREGLSGDGLVNRIAELKQEPPANLVEEAAKTAEYRLFRSPPGEITSAVMNVRNAVPGGRFVLPFLRTPGNLLATGLERSPLGVLNPSLWRNLANRSPEAADQIARITLGSGISAGLAAMVANGTIDITGPVPRNAAERDRFYREGKLPYSLRIPGAGWVQFQRMEPFNQPLAQLAGVVEATRNNDVQTADQLAGQMASTLGNNLVSETYLSGLSDFIESLEDPERAGIRFGQRTATGFLPFSSALRQIAQEIDPTVRQPEGIEESFRSVIPGLTGSVPPRLTAFGEEAERAPVRSFPIQVNPATETAVDTELERLDMEVGFVGRSIGGHELTREQRHHYQEQAGQVTSAVLTRLVQNPAYQEATGVQQEEMIDTAVKRSRQEVRDRMSVIANRLKETEAFQQLSEEQQAQELTRAYDRAIENWSQLVATP